MTVKDLIFLKNVQNVTLHFLQEQDWFGSAVAFSTDGGTLAVSAPGEDGGELGTEGNSYGLVVVFKKNPANGLFSHYQTLSTSIPFGYMGLGHNTVQINFDGSKIFVLDAIAAAAGARIQVFQTSASGEYDLVQTITPDDQGNTGQQNWYSFSIAGYGDRLVRSGNISNVNSSINPQPPTVEVYQYSSGSYQLHTSINLYDAPDLANSFNPNQAIASLVHQNHSSSNSQIAFIVSVSNALATADNLLLCYGLDQNDDYVYLGSVPMTGVQPNSNFGVSVALYGNLLAVGAPSTTVGNLINTGVVYFYTLDSLASSWASTFSSPVVIEPEAAISQTELRFGPCIGQSPDSYGMGVVLAIGSNCTGTQRVVEVWETWNPTLGSYTPWRRSIYYGVSDTQDNGFGTAVSIAGGNGVIGSPQEYQLAVGAYSGNVGFGLASPSESGAVSLLNVGFNATQYQRFDYSNMVLFT